MQNGSFCFFLYKIVYLDKILFYLKLFWAWKFPRLFKKFHLWIIILYHYQRKWWNGLFYHSVLPPKWRPDSAWVEREIYWFNLIPCINLAVNNLSNSSDSLYTTYNFFLCITTSLFKCICLIGTHKLWKHWLVGISVVAISRCSSICWDHHDSSAVS